MISSDMHSVKHPNEYLITSLEVFFAEGDLIDTMLKIVRNETMSLRTLDWFVTNYSKKNNTMFTTSEGKLFNVFLEYKAQLKSYSKRMFDPFNRGERIMFKDKRGNEFSTTVGQLNFFRWVLKHDIVSHCMQCIDDVESDMLASTRMRKASSSPNDKRRELSKAAIKKCMNISTKVTIKFD